MSGGGFDWVGHVVPLGGEVRAIAGAWGDGSIGMDDATSVADLGFTGLGLFLDPINWVVGQLLEPIYEWILNNVPACKQALDYLTGNESAIHQWAEGFQQASRETADAATELANQVQAILAEWQGAGAAAYQEAQREAIELQRSIADRQHTIYTATYALASIVTTIKEIVVGLVKDLITDLVAKGVLAAATAVPSLGSAIAAYMAWAAGKYAMVMGKVARWFQKLFTKASEVTQKFAMLSDLFARTADAFGRLAATFDQMAATAAAAAERVRDGDAHHERMKQREQQAQEHRDNAEDMRGRAARSERRRGDIEDRRAAEQRSKRGEAYGDARSGVDDAGAGPGSVTEATVVEGAAAAGEEWSGYDSHNPADDIPAL